MRQELEDKIAELELQIQELRKMVAEPGSCERGKFQKLVSEIFSHESEPERVESIFDKHLKSKIYNFWKEYHIRASLDNKLWGVRDDARREFVEEFWGELDREMGENHYIDSNYCESIELSDLYEEILEDESLTKLIRKDLSTLEGGECFAARLHNRWYDNLAALIESYLLLVEATFFKGAICD